MNLSLVYQVYEKYSENYSQTNPMIKLKKDHMLRVAQINKRLAKEIGLNNEQIELAEAIGLLHDIGRYEQIKRYHTFNDSKSIKHADLGVSILFQEGKIRNFIKEKQYDDIIKKAIFYHGQNEIAPYVQGIEKIHCQLIRDADKLDILFILATEKLDTICSGKVQQFLEGRISEEIEREFFEDHKIDYSKRKEEVECVVSWLAYPFDIYFDQTRDIIRKKNYIPKIVNRFSFTNKETQDTINRMLKEVEEFIEG